MELNVVALDPGQMQMRCAGDITSMHLINNPDPLAKLLGPDVYRQTILLDFRDASFIDSAGIGWVIGAHRKFVQAGGRLILHSVPPLIDQVLQVLQVRRIVPTAADLPSAQALATGGKS